MATASELSGWWSISLRYDEAIWTQTTRRTLLGSRKLTRRHHAAGVRHLGKDGVLERIADGLGMPDAARVRLGRAPRGTERHVPPKDYPLGESGSGR